MRVRFHLAVSAAIAVCLASFAAAAAIPPIAPAAHTGEWIARNITVTFNPLPPGWVAEQNVMDDIWKPLGLHGVNFYAYGGKTATTSHSMRSDPDSPLYQAWFGVYVVDGGDHTGKDLGPKLADLDQASWLGAMGDPHPLGLTHVHLRRAGTISIAGAERSLFEYSGRSHSDLSATVTPLVRHLGVVPMASWQGHLKPFHDLELRGYFVSWREPQRELTMIAYTAAPVFTLASGQRHDGFQQLDASFRSMLKNIRIADARTMGSTHP